MKDFTNALIEEYLTRNTDLTEKWEVFDTHWGPAKIWYSDSVSEFRSFLQNAGNTGIKGLRLMVKDGFYAAANAAELIHDNILDIAKDNYLITSGRRADFEWSSCGYPNMEACYNANIENSFAEEEDSDYDFDINREYLAYEGQDIISEDGEYLWTSDGKRHVLHADCGNFEISLWTFYSQQFPEFRCGCNPTNPREYPCFEDSELYFVLKPLIKKLYMTNM
jgi:hypothetical protein